MVKCKQLSQRAVIGLILLNFFAGCSAFLDHSDLCGKYVVEYSFGKEVLTLDSNMTYLQEIIMNDRVDTVKCTGNWKYRIYIEGIVELENPMVLVVATCDKYEKDFERPIKGIDALGVTDFGPWASLRLSSGCEGKYRVKVK